MSDQVETKEATLPVEDTKTNTSTSADTSSSSASKQEEGSSTTPAIPSSELPPRVEETSEDKQSNEDPVDTHQPLSKNALKRQRRWHRKVEVKKRRKLQVKEAKIHKAKLEGRDLDQERREMEQRTQDGTGHARREKFLMDRIKASADKSFQVCVDCSFENQMTYSELNSLAQQIRHCYAINKRSNNSVYFHVTSLSDSGTTNTVLKKVCGYPDQWLPRAFSVTCDPMEKVLEKSKLVYLTSDSDNELTELNDDKIYVIGGIVDRNRLKRATIDRAEELGIVTAKLPIANHLRLMTTSVLTVNHVFDILLHKASGKDWKEALEAALPQRKQQASDK